MKFNPYIGIMAVAGVCLTATVGQACSIYEAFIPQEINCMGEILPLQPDAELATESGKTASSHRSIVNNEEDYVTKLGKVDGGDLKAKSGGKINKIAREMRLSARDSAGAACSAKADISGVTGTYSSDKNTLEEKYVVKADSGIGYSTSSKDAIKTNQRVAMNDLATYGLSMASATSADVASFTEEEQKSGKACNSNLTSENRAKEIAKADTVQGMYEMMLILDRATYERSLKAASVEASNAGIQAMKIMTGVSDTADVESK